MSWQAKAANLLFRLRIKRRKGPVNMPAIRRRLERLARSIPAPRPHMLVEELEADGVPVMRVSRGDQEPERFLFYTHGGGFCVCSPRTHRPLLTRLARKARAVVIAPDYRLAPEHPFPAGLDDVRTAWHWFERQYGTQASAMGGDSAGGGLTFSLLTDLAARKQAMPAAAFALSPWTDLTISGESIKANARRESMFRPQHLHHCADLYLNGADPSQPAASPLFAELKGLPPCLVHVSDIEILLNDSTRMVERLRQAAVVADIDIWHGMPHVWHAYLGQIPEARAALDQIAVFMKERVPAINGVMSN